MNQWTLFSNHGHVLVCLARDNDARLRDVADAVGITERAVQNIVRDLQDSGMVSVSKQGRRNRYDIHEDTHMRHGLEAHLKLQDLLHLLGGERGVKLPRQVHEPSPPVSGGLRAETAMREAAAASAPANAPAPPRTAKGAGKKTADADGIEKKQGSLF